MTLADRINKIRIEFGVMCDKNGLVSAEFHKFPDSFGFFRGIGDHFVGDACQFGDIGRNRLFRIHECIETFDNL